VAKKKARASTKGNQFGCRNYSITRDIIPPAALLEAIDSRYDIEAVLVGTETRALPRERGKEGGAAANPRAGRFSCLLLISKKL